MNVLAKSGVTIVVFALVSYTISVITEQRSRRVSPSVLLFLTVGLLLDVTATAFMILGSSKGPFTLHGILGYSSLAGMLVDTWLIWRFARSHPADTPVPLGLHLYTRSAYGWWLAAFVTGGLLVAMR